MKNYLVEIRSFSFFYVRRYTKKKHAKKLSTKDFKSGKSPKFLDKIKCIPQLQLR